MKITPEPALPASESQANLQSQSQIAKLHIKFPAFKHEKHGPAININKAADERLTAGDRIADAVASTVGSWRFIIIQSIILLFWLVLNTLAWINHWDPYPFILLNLALSFQAAYSAPFVMMSQNRQASKDRLTAENDYKTDLKGEQEICHIMDHLDHQDNLILQIVEHLDQQDHAILQIVERLEDQHKQMRDERNDLLAKINQLIDLQQTQASVTTSSSEA
jgi:Predicted membrane protein